METNLDKELDTEKEIDLIDLGKKLWTKRKFILKGSAIGLFIGIVVAFSIPKEYTTTVILAPEANSSSGAGGMGALAAMAGVNLGGALPEGQMSPELYPKIVASTPFIIGLFDIKVKDTNSKIDTTLYSYIKDEQKSPWWSKILSLPGAVLGLFSKERSNDTLDIIDNFALTGSQTAVINDLQNRIGVSVDKKTGTISLASTMQNPEVSALIADTLISYLQSYIINYRTQKARQDLSFTEKLYTEAKSDYTQAQQKYARYLDENQNVILASYRVNQEKLQNEMTLAYAVYNQMAQQLQMAKVKVQDIMPVYTVIQPAVVPLIPMQPNKKLIVIGFVCMTIVGCCTWILGKDFLGKN